MIAHLSPSCGLREKAAIIGAIEAAGLHAHVEGSGTCARILVPGARPAMKRVLLALSGVERVEASDSSYALVARSAEGDSGDARTGTRVRVGGVTFGDPGIVICAGPCAVEGEESIGEAARAVRESGAHLLRGGAFKPRTSPYSFQGLGEQGLRLLAEAGRREGLGVVTEVISPEVVGTVARHADMLQVGARNMQNFALLKAVGETDRPVLLKRGMMATIEELLLAAEYVVSAGNPSVVLCERGIRSFDRATRNTFDVSAIPLLKRETHLPVIADPSHGCGRRDLVPSVALAAVAAGADGLLLEVHPDPARALSDGPQSLRPDDFARLVQRLDAIAHAVGRELAQPNLPQAVRPSLR